MVTQQAQIKVNLPVQLKEYLESKANRFGMPLAGYIKHLILKEVSDMDYPVFEASDRTIKAYKKALKERTKATKVKGDIGEFLEKL
jgi:predicted DNA-binding protein